MKKLFVLFLLVALVPFTVGCGLFGDNDDTSPVPNLTNLKASVVVPAAAVPPSIRAARVSPAVKFANYKITIGGYELVVIAEDKQANGDYILEFQTATPITVAQANEVKKTSVPVVIKDASNNAVSAATIDFSAAAPISISITLSAGGVIQTVSNDSTTVVPGVTNATAGDPASIVSVKNNGVAVSGTTAVVLVNGMISFDVEASVEFDATVDRNFSVVVGNTTINQDHFVVSQTPTQKTAKTVTLTLTQAAMAKLIANKTYTVTINFLGVDGYLISGGSYSFKTPATI